MLRDSRVLEHVDTKSVADSRSSPRHDTVILAKWRPFGKSNNRRVAARIPLLASKPRDPVSLGDVGGALRTAVSPSG